jgi:CRP-like cAMP-binding protein
MPYATENEYLFPHFRGSVCYPFAGLVSDFSEPLHARLPLIEQSLGMPGKQGMRALVALKRDTTFRTSSLEAGEEFAALTRAVMAQQGIPMCVRGQMRDVGEEIRAFPFFGGLSDAEATLMGTLMEGVNAQAGRIVVRQAEPDTSLYLIRSGQATIQIGRDTRQPATVATLGQGDCFGEVGVLTGEPNVGDLVAVTPLRLFRLSRETYLRYLGRLPEVEARVARGAVRRANETLRTVLHPTRTE